MTTETYYIKLLQSETLETETHETETHEDGTHDDVTCGELEGSSVEGGTAVLKNEIRDFLVKHRASQGAGDFADEESLLDQGIIDSLTMVDLITFIEASYRVRIDDDDMTPENFDSLVAIVALVQSKRGESETASA